MNTEEQDELVKFDKYIKYLKENKPQKKERTFFYFDGKGQSIKDLRENENYISDILSMFFDTNNSHGYGDLFIKALLECLNEKYDDTNFKSTKCKSWREVNCDGTRLDIVLECEDYVFGLEHKVYSEPKNPFKIYKKFLNKKYQGLGEENINLVLFTLEDYDGDDVEIEEEDSIDYYINYAEFFKKLNKIKDKYPNKSKYKVYLEDLLLNINILQEGEFEPVEKRDKKLLELVVENPDIFDVRDRAIKEIFSEEGSLYKKMSAYIERKDLLRDIKIEYYSKQLKIIEAHINFYLKHKNGGPYFTIMYYVDDGNNKKRSAANSLELLRYKGVLYEGSFEFEPSFAPGWSEVWWNNEHPVYELDKKLYEDGFEEKFLNKAKEIFAFVEKALKS